MPTGHGLLIATADLEVDELRRLTRHSRSARLAAIVVLVQAVVSVGPSVPPAGAAAGYQSDGIDFQDITASNVYNVDLELWVTSRGSPCADWGESCEYGLRRTSGYTWLPPSTSTLA